MARLIFLAMKKVISILVLCHLMLVVLSITHRSDRWLYKGFWTKPLLLYSGLSYAIWRFGFFAPDVGRSTEVEMNVYNDAGEVQRYDTLDGFRFFVSTLESSNRFYTFKTRCVRENLLKDLCARSASTRMLNLHTNATRVQYAARSIRYPTMDEYSRGAPVRKVEYYSTTFILRKQPADGEVQSGKLSTNVP